MKFIIGEKQNMTQIWKEDKVLAVTAVKVESCVISQIKDENKDKYSAVQVAYGSRKAKNLKKPQLEKFKKLNLSPKYVREFRINEELKDLKVGDEISISSFEVGDKIKATGTSKGRGFQGVVKRHGFSGSKATHGNKDQLRMPGSIGSTGPAHVFKGMRMPGRMGNDRISIANLEIIEVDLDNNLLYVKGALPGHRNSLVLISAEGELKLVEKEAKTEDKEEKKEEVKEEKSTGDDKKEEVKEEEKKEEEPQEEKAAESNKAESK